jgi:hypothetical protein
MEEEFGIIPEDRSWVVIRIQYISTLTGIV